MAEKRTHECEVSSACRQLCFTRDAHI